YNFGYGRYQSDVLVPAFLAAYTDNDPMSSTLKFMEVTPKPNWQLSYNGLNKLPFFSELFSNFALRHGYQSNLNINSFSTDCDYEPDPVENINHLTANYYSPFAIPDVVSSAQINPSVGVAIRTKNE